MNVHPGVYDFVVGLVRGAEEPSERVAFQVRVVQ